MAGRTSLKASDINLDGNLPLLGMWVVKPQEQDMFLQVKRKDLGVQKNEDKSDPKNN